MGKTLIAVPCAHCGTELKRPPNQVKTNKNQFCNHTCYGLWRKGKDFHTVDKKITVTCVGCGVEFKKVPNLIARKQRHFCNLDCYRQHVNRKVQFTCEQCGVVFERTQSAQKGKHIFCSPPCIQKWRSENERGANNALFTQQPVNCDACGKTLMRARGRVESNRHHFCNQVCRGKWQSKNKIGEAHPMWTGGGVDVNCAYCGTQMRRQSYDLVRSDNFFCNLDCRGKWQSENMVGEASNQWKGGWSSYYGPNWHQQRHEARERDDHTCQICGITREELGKEPDVHHIRPFREFGFVYGENENYKQANHLSNLVTLCPSCHHRAEFGKLDIPNVEGTIKPAVSPSGMLQWTLFPID